MTGADGEYHPPDDAEAAVRCELATPVADAGAGGTTADPACSRATRHLQVKLAAVPAAVSWARRVVQRALREWRLESVSESAMLLVSELATNAVQASGGGSGRGSRNQRIIVLILALTETGVLLQVWDSSPVLPVLQDADVTSDQGRGLLLVDVLADAWGHHCAGSGKVVWCELATG